jgi:hypothetical protein
MAGEQRRNERRQVGWPAHYRQPHTDGWRPCRLIDIAEGGAAIEAFGLRDDEELTGSIELELRAPARFGEMVRIHGRVRYSSRSAEGRTRVGIELEPSSVLDADLLEALVRLNAFS